MTIWDDSVNVFDTARSPPEHSFLSRGPSPRVSRKIREVPSGIPECHSEWPETKMEDPTLGEGTISLLQTRVKTWQSKLDVPWELMQTCDENVLDAEVGDDYIALLKCVKFLRHLSVLETIFTLKVSEKDVSINQIFGTFAEGVFRKPQSQMQTWSHNRISKKYGDLSMLDIPKLRTLVDSESTRMNASETFEGRSSHLRGTLGQNSRAEMTNLYPVCSLFQGISMGFNLKKPHYIPVTLGGLGDDVPWKVPENFVSYFRFYKAGKYMPVAAALVRRVLLHQESMDKEIVQYDPVLDSLAKSENLFRDWMKHDTPFVPTSKVGIPESIVNKRLFRASDVRKECLPAINRAVGLRLLVIENAISHFLEAESLVTMLQADLQVSETRDLLLAKKKAAWASIENWGPSVINRFMEFDSFSEDTTLTLGLIAKFLALDKRKLTRSYLCNEYLYPESVLDEIHGEGLLHIEVPMKMEAMEGKVIPDYKDPTIDPHIEALRTWCRSDPCHVLPPTNLIEDDDVLVRMAMETKELNMVVVTNDFRMIRRISNICPGKRIWRYPPIRYCSLGGPDDSALSSFGVKTFLLLEDKGSISHCEETQFYNGSACNYLTHPVPWGEVGGKICMEEYGFEDWPTVEDEFRTPLSWR